MRKYLAEFIGTFVLVFGGCGAAVFAGEKIGFYGVALAFGLTLLTMAYAIGPVSGCHINPAVTFGMLLSKRIGGRDAGAYVVAQVLGAIAASAVLLITAKGIAGGYDPSTAGLPPMVTAIIPR
jgi:aquaporin Z